MSLKKKNKYFRDMAALAHERELKVALGELHSCFKLWKKGEVSAFDLNRDIHVFHDGKSRDIYKLYTMGEPQMSVAYAIASGILTKAEINLEYTQEIQATIDSFRGVRNK
jgi:hypothetical protein